MIDRYRNYQPVSRRPPEPKKSRHRGRRRLLTLSILIALCVFGYFKITNGQDQSTTNDTPKAAPVVKKVTATPIPATAWADIEAQVNAAIVANPDLNIGVSIIDSKTNTKVDYGSQEQYAGASTTKVLTAAAFLQQVEQGKYTLQTKLAGRTAQDHLRLMLNRSNNESWATLNTAVGYSALTQYARDNGINSYNYIGNLMKPSDQALLLQKVYKRELVNEEHTLLMLSYMQNTNNEDMIPVVTPTDATLYHKYGQLEDRLHDGAIIEYKKRPLILVIYTKGGATNGSIYGTRIALIQSIAKSVIDTFYTAK